MQKSRIIIYLAGFLFSIPIALTSYINSSFLESFADAKYIGIVYVIGSIITILAMLEMPRILTRLGNRRTVLLFGALTFLSFLTMAFAKESSVVIGAFVLYFLSMNFIIASLDIFVEDFSKGSSIGKFRGAFLLVCNLAWVIAQMMSGSVIAKSSFRGIYILSALFILLFSVVFIFFLENFKDPKYKRIPIARTIKSFIQNKNISKIYIINLILRFFFAWMIIYTPIYLHQYLGFDWTKIGLIFTFMLTPFVILDLPLGKLSDRIGEKKILIIGFLISAIFTLAIPLITKPTLWLWALILFGTRLGAACIEVMSESYFFKSVTEKNDDEISFFRSTGPFSFIIAPLVATPVLLLVPSFKYLFFILGAVMLLGAHLSLKLKDVK